MENVKLKTPARFAKIVGVVLVLASATTLALYKGPHWKPTHYHPLGHHSEQGPVHSSSCSTWIKGCFLILTSNMLWGLWLVLQGIVVTGVSFYLQAWCIDKMGPVFLAMSTPLSLIIIIFCSTAFLGETIYTGSILGGIFLVYGLYSVLWGKSTENKFANLKLEDAKEKNEEQSSFCYVMEVSIVKRFQLSFVNGQAQQVLCDGLLSLSALFCKQIDHKPKKLNTETP